MNEPCPTCGHTQREYWFHLDYSDAKALLSIGKIVEERFQSGKPWYEANRVNMANYNGYFTKTQFDRKTQLMYLGLIEKVIGVDGRQIASTWQLTPAGRHFLVGGSVKKSALVKEKQVTLRSLDETNLRDVMQKKEPEFNNYPWKTNCFSF